MIDPTSVFDRPIAFQRGFVSLGCGITGALMLSQAVYWSKRTSDPDGWFYKTAKEWEEETGLTRCEQETARARLNNIGVLQEKKQGVPCKLYYRVDFKALLQLCGFAESSMRETSKLDVSKPAYKSAGIRQSSTEITTETTTDINTGVATAPAKPKRKTKAESLFDKIRKSDFNLINQASDEILKEWCKHRVKKGASDSDLAHRDIEKHLQILIDHGLTVDQSFTEQVSRGWAGLKSEWYDCVKTGVSANNGNYNPDSDWTKNIGDTF